MTTDPRGYDGSIRVAQLLDYLSTVGTLGVTATTDEEGEAVHWTVELRPAYGSAAGGPTLADALLCLILNIARELDAKEKLCPSAHAFEAGPGGHCQRCGYGHK